MAGVEGRPEQNNPQERLTRDEIFSKANDLIQVFKDKLGQSQEFQTALVQTYLEHGSDGIGIIQFKRENFEYGVSLYGVSDFTEEESKEFKDKEGVGPYVGWASLNIWRDSIVKIHRQKGRRAQEEHVELHTIVFQDSQYDKTHITYHNYGRRGSLSQSNTQFAVEKAEEIINNF